jgi:hypothetical protein
MMLFSANGPRAIPDDRVLFIYRDGGGEPVLMSSSSRSIGKRSSMQT